VTPASTPVSTPCSSRASSAPSTPTSIICEDTDIERVLKGIDNHTERIKEAIDGQTAVVTPSNSIDMENIREIYENEKYAKLSGWKPKGFTLCSSPSTPVPATFSTIGFEIDYNALNIDIDGGWITALMQL
jgi:hypothetical protein